MHPFWTRMTSLLSLSILCAAAQAQAPEPAPPAGATPQTYVLIAAMGVKFSLDTDTNTTRLTYTHRQRLTASNDILNRMVLQELDKNVAAMDPGSVRIYLSLATPSSDRVVPDRREQFTLDAVVAELKKYQKERGSWNRIIVVTPAYRALGKNLMGDKLQGMGVFFEPLCQSNITSCNMGFTSVSGPAAVTPDGEQTTANTFVAPYSYLTVWQLDPATLNVIARTQVFKDEKISTQQYGELDKHAIAAHMTHLIGTSIREGLHRSDTTGHVEVVELNESALPASPR